MAAPRPSPPTEVPERTDAPQRAEELAERLLPEIGPKKRMLVIVNPYATTVSDKLKNLVVYALQSRYAVEAVDTQEREDATALCREAASEDYDVVVAFGGDGTVNGAANGLAGSDTPLTCLPGGSTNVWCRTLGIPADVVDATEHLLGLADRFQPRRVDLGTVDGRHFVFSSGVGLDASVVERVGSDPSRKARYGPWYYAYAAVGTYSRRYVLRPPRVRVEAGGRTLEAVAVIVQNSEPYTYFRGRPIHLCDAAAIDDGKIAVTALRRTTPLQVATLVPRLFSARRGSVLRHRHADCLPGLTELRVERTDAGAFPLQVDGDYVGELDAVTYGVMPGGLAVLA